MAEPESSPSESSPRSKFGSEAEGPTYAPAPTMSRGMLIAALVVVCTLPVVIVGLLWTSIPARPYPALDVDVERSLAAGEIDPSTGQPAAFPRFRIENVGEDELFRVVVYADDAFGNHYQFNYDEKPFAPGDVREFDAANLALRTGHTLKPETPLEAIEVSARLPYGARGLSKWRLENGLPIPESSANRQRVLPSGGPPK